MCSRALPSVLQALVISRIGVASAVLRVRRRATERPCHRIGRLRNLLGLDVRGQGSERSNHLLVRPPLGSVTKLRVDNLTTNVLHRLAINQKLVAENNLRLAGD